MSIKIQQKRISTQFRRLLWGCWVFTKSSRPWLCNHQECLAEYLACTVHKSSLLTNVVELIWTFKLRKTLWVSHIQREEQSEWENFSCLIPDSRKANSDNSEENWYYLWVPYFVTASTKWRRKCFLHGICSFL